MSISFRTRLFVIAGLIVTAVITLVMIVGWTRVLAFEAERFEKRLCMEAQRVATQPFNGLDSTQLVSDILSKLHLVSPDQIMVQFEPSAQGENGKPQDAQVPRDNKPPPPNGGPPRGDRPNTPVDCTVAYFKVGDKQWIGARSTAATGRSLVAADLAATRADVQSALKQALEMVVPLAIALTAMGAWLLSVLTMRPVNRLRDAMQVVTQKALNQRMPSQGEDREFKVLIDAYNTMLSRLELSFLQASRFSADAAHELKTPLTILQGRIEQSLNKQHTPDVQIELTDMLDEVGRLSSITRKLLLLSQADSGWLDLQRIHVDLSSTLDDIAADAQMLLSDQTFDSLIDRRLSIQGDAMLLQQLFNNLLSNAVRYCSPRGWIKLTARALSSGVEMEFSNSSRMIAAGDRTQFFDRFYRGDAAHNRRIEGNGLGLSLAREIAKAHGGDLVLMDTPLDIVTLRLTIPASNRRQ
jgi:two-component system, OmpR family, heavy metal sensor histidine kinase CusS